MEKLVSSWCKDKFLPDSYIVPPETRPGKLNILSDDTIPVLDLGEASINPSNAIQKVLKASQEFGFFQVHTIYIYIINFFYIYWNWNTTV